MKNKAQNILFGTFVTAMIAIILGLGFVLVNVAKADAETFYYKQEIVSATVIESNWVQHYQPFRGWIIDASVKVKDDKYGETYTKTWRNYPAQSVGYITSLEKGTQVEVTVNSKCRRDTDEVINRTITF